jgi:DNA-binding response OmpR family regulator
LNILLADDDRETVDLTSYSLGQYGYTVVPARNNVQALRRWRAEPPDLVLLDVDLPERGGLEVCREIRQVSRTPIIMLGDRSTEDEVVRSFLVGADDYLAKPFSHRELAMRIRAVVSRHGRGDEAPIQPQLVLGDLHLDLESHEVGVADGSKVVRLTPTEFRILQMLALNAGRVVSTSRLVNYAWTYESADPSMLKIHVSRLRRKLAMLGLGPSSIKAIRWVGYSLHSADGSRLTR